MQYVESICFSDLAESEEFVKFYNICSKLTGIKPVIASSNGADYKILYDENQINPVCRIIHSTEKGLKVCQSTDCTYLAQAVRLKKGIWYYCHAGMVDFAVPIYIENKHIATINCGQIFTEKPSEKGFKELCKKIKIIPVDLKRLKKAYFACPYLQRDKLDMILELFSFFAKYFCEVGRRLQSANKNQKRKEIDEAERHIKENFREDISLTDVINYVAMSKVHFSRLFKKATGTSYIHYLTNLRLGETKKLLAQTDWSITRIAYHSGFNSLAYFNQTFQKVQGCSPSSYRKKVKLKK